MKTGTSVVALAALVLGSCAASAADIPGWCQYALSDAPKNVPKFESYAVPVQRVTHAPRVQLLTSRARLYRTQLRNAAVAGAKYGPNFARHYALAGWGCGTNCLNWAVVDVKTGQVGIGDAMFSLENQHIDFHHEKEDDAYTKARHATYQFGVLLFRPDSSMLLTLGSPNEDEARDGMAYYRWTGKTFQKLAFTPAMKLCHRPRD